MSSIDDWFEKRYIMNVYIGKDVTSIGTNTFRGCGILQHIEVESGNPKYDSRNSCNAIIQTADNSLIIGCNKTIIPNTVTYINYDAFHDCRYLTSITIPNSVRIISSGAFQNCSGLNSINVEFGNSKYDSRNNCNAIIYTASNTLITGCKNTVIPNDVTSIGSDAFRGCSGLTSITIPNSVTSIGSNAFLNCSGLTSVISYIEEPFDSDYISSSETYNNATLYVPIGTADKYKARNGWKNFIHIEEGDPSSINDIITNDTEEIGRYTLNGTKASNTHKGVNIVKMSNGRVKKVVVK